MNLQFVQRTERSPKIFEGEIWLVLTGLLGFLLAGFCAIWVLFNGGPISPNGDVAKALSFNAALGAFMLSTAAIVPLSAMGGKSRSFFRWSYIILALYSYGVETVQHFRGVNPRFVEGGTPIDVLLGSIFAFVALLLILYYLFLASYYFRRKAYKNRPELVLGIRYAMIATVLSFAAGIWISVNEGRYTGMGGNIIIVHGLGFHALQAVPFVAWLTERAQLPAAVRRRYVHLAGITFLLGLLAVGWQTMIGRTVMEWSTFPLLAAFCFLIGMSAAAAVLRNALNNRRFSSAANPSNMPIMRK
jgi:hypothetical protein